MTAVCDGKERKPQLPTRMEVVHVSVKIRTYKGLKQMRR